MRQHPIDEPGQVRPHGLDGFAGTQAAAQVPEASTQIAVATGQRAGRHAQGLSHSIVPDTPRRDVLIHVRFQLGDARRFMFLAALLVQPHPAAPPLRVVVPDPHPHDGADAGERNATWVRGAWKQLEPFTQGHYVNIMTSDATDNRAHSAYGDNYPRLAAIKKRYDPNNLFHLNANIKPA